MKLGIGLANGGASPNVEALVTVAVRAEELGFDSVWTMDRWLRPTTPVRMPGVPVPVEMPSSLYRVVFDPIDLLAFIAARTSRIQLGTSAINVLYHPPVMLARRLATLDHLCGGRLIAGVTSGWMEEEFVVAGVSSSLMGSGFDEHLAAMRRVWGQDPVSFDSAHFSIPEADIGPKPFQRTIPLIVGYNTHAGIRRAARIGDGLHPYRNDFDELRSDLAVFAEARASHPGMTADPPIVLRVFATTEPDRNLFAGPVESWVDDIQRLADIGVGHVVVQVDGDDTMTVSILERLSRRRTNT